MQQAYSVRLSLRIYGIILSMLLPSCNNISNSYPTQAIRVQLVKEKNLDQQEEPSNKLIKEEDKENRNSNGRKTYTYQETIGTPKEQPIRVAIRTKKVNQTSKWRVQDAQEQVGTSIISTRRFAKRKLRQGLRTTFKESTPGIKTSSLEKVAEEHIAGDNKTKDLDLDKEAREVKTNQKRLCRRAKRRVIKGKHKGAKLDEKVDVDLVVEASSLSALESLPVELLQGIFSYLRFREMLPARGVNHFFHSLTTGYNQVGVVGIANKPDSRKLVDSWYVDSIYLGNIISFTACKKFRKGIWDHETIPSFIFYHFIEVADDLPEVYWSCLPATYIRGFRLSDRKMTFSHASELGECLAGSKVRELSLRRSQLGDKEVATITKNLTKTEVKIVDFHYNHIGPQGAKILFKKLQGKKVKKVDLSNNRIGDEGLRYISKYIANIQLASLSIISNNIEYETLNEFLKNLGKESSLKQIFLGGNKFTKEERSFIGKEYAHIKFC